MEHPNTLWLLGTCVAVPSVIYFIILLGDQGVLRLTYKRIKLATKVKAPQHPTSVVASLTTSDIDLSCHSRQPVSTAFNDHLDKTLVELVSGNQDSSPTRSRCCSPLLSACGSTAGSIAGSTTGSQSSVHSDSDGESDDHASNCSNPGASHCCHPFGSCSAASTSVPTSPAGPPSNDQHSPPLRSAMRRPCVSLTTSPSGGQHTKSVSFKAGGAVICSPPTEEALGLLAAGAPPLPVLCSRAPASSEPTDSCNLETLHSTDTFSPIVSRPFENSSRSTTSASIPAGACRATTSCTPLVAACSTPYPTARGPHSEGRTMLSDTASKSSTLTRSASSGLGWLEHMDRINGCTGAAHELARARAETGRRRVMAAMAAARHRHAHLGGRSSMANDSWASHDAAVHSCTGREQYTPELQPQWLQPQSQEHGPGFHYQPVADRANGRLARLPNLPLASRDSDILAVGYAQPSELVTAVAAATATGGKAAMEGLDLRSGRGASLQLTTEHHPGVAQASSFGGALTSAVSRRGGSGMGRDGLSGLLAAAGVREGGAGALRDVLVADRIRLAEMLTKQSYQL